MGNRFGGKTASLLALLFTAAPSLAMADGLEFAGAGARATSRGGAYVVGSTDSMALSYNPANLAAVQGMQLHASLGLLGYNSCFQRDGTYGASADGINRGGFSNGANPFGSGALRTNEETGLSDGAGGTLSFDDIRDIPNPEVCNGHRVNVVPQITYAWRIHERIGIGLGVIAPNAPGNLQFGETIDGRAGMVRAANGLILPAPSRYMLIGQQALIAWPTIGVGIEILPKVRVGGSFGWGFGQIGYQTMATPYYSENIALDIYSDLAVHDTFIPRIGAGVSAGPWKGMSFGASFTYYGDLDASGTLHASTLYYLDPALRSTRRAEADIPVSLATQLPWQVVGGFRYGHERQGRTLPEDAIGDSMDTEVWNIEANVGFTKGSRLSGFDVRLSEVPLPEGYDRSLPANDPANAALYPCTSAISGDPTPGDNYAQACVHLNPILPAGVPLTFPAPVRHNWKDQIFFRVGGDYNVVPGRLALSAGVSYDGNGQQRGYEQLDFQPYRRVGAHLGFTVRVNRWDMTVAFAHHFNQTRRVSYLTACPGNVADGTAGGAVDRNGDGDLEDVVGGIPEGAFCTAPEIGSDTPITTDDDWGLHPLAATPNHTSDISNSGRFRSSLDVLQLAATYHFR